jgi:5-deoxy-D-glucuronate isomerase
LFWFSALPGLRFQFVYGGDGSIDGAMVVADSIWTMGPRGHRPVGETLGYDFVHLKFMAGHRRQWCFKRTIQRRRGLRKFPGEVETR